MTAAAHLPHIWTRLEYERLIDSGGLPPESRVELVDGDILDTPPQKSRHATAVQLSDDALRATFGRGFSVRTQLPLAIDDYSEPEPDIAVVAGSPRDYRDAHPTTAALIVEVADSSLEFDRTRKLALYARNAIPEYWILSLPDGVLEVHRDPVGETYASRSMLAASEQVTPLHARGDRALAVAEVLP
jgi:Uma2 family endonuclease